MHMHLVVRTHNDWTYIYTPPQGLNRVLKVLKGTETVKQDDDSAME